MLLYIYIDYIDYNLWIFVLLEDADRRWRENLSLALSTTTDRQCAMRYYYNTTIILL